MHACVCARVCARGSAFGHDLLVRSSLESAALGGKFGVVASESVNVVSCS